jgi:peptidyl-prolyl cis-trans isomerase C
MKCAPVLSLTLASAMLVAAGCEKDSDQAKPADAPGASAAPAKPAADPNEVVASVGDTKLLRKDLEEKIASFIKARNVPADQLEAAHNSLSQDLTRQFILKTVLIDEAKKQNFTVTDEERTAQKEKMEAQLKAQGKTLDDYYKEFPFGEKAAKADFEDALLINKLIETNVLAGVTVEKADIDQVVDEVKKRNEEIAEKNKNLDASKATAKAKIEDIKKQLDAGADFAELAKANSDCPSGKNGGDLGEFARGAMVKPFEDAAFTQEIGKIGDIVETQFGYHLIRVTAKTPATEASGDTPAAPEKVTASHILVKTEQAQQPQPVPTEDQIREHLKQGKSREAVQKYLEDLKAAAKIETIFKDMQF